MSTTNFSQREPAAPLFMEAAHSHAHGAHVVQFSIDRLPDMIELTLFRALQEALTHVHRHSGASTADIRIQRSGEQVILEVKDNGCGIEQNMLTRFRKTGNGMGVGLTSMCERVRDLGGTFQVDSGLSGTAVRIAIPVMIAENAGT